MDASQTTTLQAPGLSRKIGLAWAALAWEGLWPRLVPALAFVALFIAAAHLDLFAGLDPWVHTGILAALALALVGMLWWRLRDFALPTHEAAIRRLERDSGVPHRPLVAVQDRLAAGGNDSMAAALWEAHRRREAARLAGLSNKPARPGLAVLDTWALRFVPILALIVALAIAGGWRSDRMVAAFTPAFPPPPPVVANLWIAPPAYTGKPPIYLDMAEHDKLLRVPVGSKLAGFVDDVRGRKPPQLVIDGKGTEFATVGKGKYQVEQIITEGKEITLQARGDEQAHWKLHVIPDLAPTIEFAKPIGVDKWSTKIEYIAGDDFGVTGVQLQVRLHGSVLGADMLSDDEEPEVIRVDLPVAGNTKKVADTFVRDLTSHPWAGLKVTVMLFATDALDQKGRSSVETFLLPFWSSASVANSITVTLRPAQGWLVRSRTKVSATFLVLPATGRSTRMTSGSSSSLSMSAPSTLPCRRTWSCTPVTPKSSPAMYSILVDHLSTPIGLANSMVGARSGMTCSFQCACSSPRACSVISLPSVMICSTWYLPLPTVANSVPLPSITSCGGLRPRTSSTKPASLLPTGTRNSLSCSAMSR